MALGDGTTWDETEPTESTEASLAPVYINDDRVGTRKRMQNEHYWPASQTSVLQGGQHSYITLQAYNGFPGFIVNNSGTSLQVGGLWVDSTNNLWFTATGSTGPGTVPYILNGYCMISATDTAPNYLGVKCTAGIGIIGTTAGTSAGGTVIGISGALGSWTPINGSQVYHALTDLWVSAWAQNTGGRNTILVLSDPSTSPSTTRAISEFYPNTNNMNVGVTCFIRKNDYFNVIVGSQCFYVSGYSIALGG